VLIAYPENPPVLSAQVQFLNIKRIQKARSTQQRVQFIQPPSPEPERRVPSTKPMTPYRSSSCSSNDDGSSEMKSKHVKTIPERPAHPFSQTGMFQQVRDELRERRAALQV